MKKKITKPDGSVEEIQGTPEEIAEYERKLRGGVREAPQKQGPSILKDEIQRLADPVYPFAPMRVMSIEHSPHCEVSVAAGGWWSINPPHCNCGFGQRHYQTSKIVWTSVQTGGKPI